MGTVVAFGTTLRDDYVVTAKTGGTNGPLDRILETLGAWIGMLRAVKTPTTGRNCPHRATGRS